MNNLQELFEIQAGLDAEILKNHPIQPGEDRLEKKHAALLVELGEMFNEWRAFKFWSHDQKPRTQMYRQCEVCKGEVFVKKGNNDKSICKNCDMGYIEEDLVLKELVDCLHFVLSIGLEQGYNGTISTELYETMQFFGETTEQKFIQLMQFGWSYEILEVYQPYEEGLQMFLSFCKHLGYTWEQVTAAYLEKNQENHYRQMNGY